MNFCMMDFSVNLKPKTAMNIFIMLIISLRDKILFQWKWLLKIPCSPLFFFGKPLYDHTNRGILKIYHRIISIKM